MIEFPTNCPCCDSILEEKNFLLYCMSSECPAKIKGKIVNFSKALEIKGLGPATIEKLPLGTVSDLYFLDDMKLLASCIGSEKMAEKLYIEIKKSLNTTLAKVIQGFSVPLVGKTIATKLAAVIDSLDQIDEAKCDLAKIGPAAKNNLLTFMETSYNTDGWKEIPFNFQKKQQITVNTLGTVCLTGKLVSYKTKAEAELALQQAGYSVASSLTKAVTILVNESGVESAKTVQAREKGIEVITNLKEFLSGDN